jgi:hypothetical protein
MKVLTILRDLSRSETGLVVIQHILIGVYNLDILCGLSIELDGQLKSTASFTAMTIDDIEFKLAPKGIEL